MTTPLQEDPFWMVWGEGQRAPTFKHVTRGSADTEAERLANTHRGVQFVVLEAKVGFKLAEPVPPMERTNFFELPF